MLPGPDPVAITLDAFMSQDADTDASALALDRASFEQVMADPGLGHPDRIRAAIERADHDDAAIRALACVKLGLALPPQLIADVLVGVEQTEVFLTLARQLTGEDIEPLLDLVRRGRLGDSAVGFEQTAYTVFVLWQMQVPDRVRPVIVPWLRRLARLPWPAPRAVGLVGWLAGQIGDPHLQAIYAEQHPEIGDQLAEIVGKIVLEIWSMTLDEVIALLPERAPDLVLVGVPVRAAPKVGRNEPCPCGSGKKFKRCCGDKPAAAATNAGPSRSERLRALEPRLEREQIAQLSRADLARLDLTRLRDLAVIHVMRRQAQFHDWHRACLAVDELRRRGKELAEGHLEDVIHEAVEARQYDVARELLPKLEPIELAADLQLEVTLAARGPDALARLEAAALAAVEADSAIPAVDLSHSLLRAMPALGLLIARGALQTGELFDGAVLLDAIEEARDDLQLPPGDPAQERFDALGGVRRDKAGAAADAERARLTRTAADLRASLDSTSERLATLQRQVAERERELARTERTSAESSQPAIRIVADEGGRRVLRDKIDELQALIRERNEERADLRRQLAEATDSEAATPAAPQAAARRRAAESDDADEEVEALPADPGGRAVLLPRFGAGAKAALDTVPRNVAAITMRTVGALAAGDLAAWRAVKQAKDMSQQVLMARVGIHHRLLFRTDDGALDVLDLVTRERLQTTLKRLRAI
jgi:hypothetical protein